MNKWQKLWEIATDDPSEKPCTITPDLESEDRVLVTWDDGSQAGLYWHHVSQSWRFEETLCNFPCDVAARDSF
jgi:hypothetical protein